MKLAFAFAALLVAAVSMPACAAGVHGTVVRRSLQGVRPLPNLLLTLRSSTNQRSARVYTDASGEFWFYNIPNGRYVLELWRNGMDEAPTSRTNEACSLNVTGSDMSLAQPLRLHSRPLRVPAELRDCGAGLEHLYMNG